MGAGILSIEEIVNRACEAEIELFLSEGKLRAKAEKGKISEEIKTLIRDNKQALIDYLKAQESQGKDNITRQESSVKYVPWLSYAQQRLWFVDQLGGGSVQYNIPGRFHLQNGLDITAFQRALKSLIERHEVLRTHFQSNEGQPRQVIKQQFELPFVQHDISDLEDEDKQREALRLIELEASTPFDLCNDMMLRVRAVKLSEKHFLILYTQHHIASDGWSMEILKNELKALYSAYTEGRENPLKPLKIQYADYALWQRDWLQGEVLEKQTDYWHNQLAGIPGVHNLPTDKPRPQQQSYNALRYRQVLKTSTANKVKSLCEQQGVSLFIFLETVFAVLLSRFSNDKDIVVGTPIAGRTHKDVEGLIGFFVNSLVLRTDLSGNPSFLALLKRNKEVILDAFSNQHIPFEMLVEHIRPERDLSYNPIFQVLFVVQNNNKGEWGYEQVKTNQGASNNDVTASIGRTRFDLELHVYESHGELSLRWVYNSDLFEQSSIKNLSDGYAILLDDILSTADMPVEKQSGVTELNLLTQPQSKQILLDWNPVQNPPGDALCIHHSFEYQAQQNPEKVAVLFQDEELTYQDLNQRANKLAHYLIDAGVVVGDKVALCMERSEKMLVGLLGTLKAGCAYVPLDPSYPKSRLEFVLNDCKVKTVLGLSSSFPELHNQCEILLLDDDKFQGRLQSFPHNNPEFAFSDLSAENLAYIIYTSGSTGKPKGVMVSHRNVFNYLQHGKHYVQQTVGAVVSTALVFDATVCSLLIPLCVGQYVELLEDDNMVIGSLIDYVVDDTDRLLFKVTPSHLKALINSDLISDNNQAQHILVVGGEQLTRSTLEEWQKRFPNTTIINEYGPTEATVGCSVYAALGSIDYGFKLPGTTATPKGTTQVSIADIVPIGTAIDNARLYVLNESQLPQPAGITGELFIGGEGVTQGYQNQPAMTASKFIPDPFSSEPGERLYCTGDSVRWLADGTLEFIERLDDQVKVRGFRIELGEIESAIFGHMHIGDSVVSANLDGHGNAQLLAYICPASDFLEKTARELNKDNVEQWTDVFDDTYHDSTQVHEVELNYAGWDSSYTMAAIQTNQMNEWLQETMKVIQSLEPENLLEVGCGTGLLLFRYAEQCQLVRAFDISQSALKSVNQGIKQRDWQHVELSQGDALSVANLPKDQQFDSAVINSVAQYFPNLFYLEEMLSEIIDRLKDGGRVLLGDIRNLDLFGPHVTAVERSRLTKSTPVSVVSSRVQRRIQQEQELLISPSYFYRFAEQHPDIESVDLLVKRGIGDNEMVRYRYEVILTRKGRSTGKLPLQESEWWDFTSISDVEAMLSKREVSRFGVSGIDNARVTDDIALWNGLREWQAGRLIHPEALPGRLGEAAQHRVEQFDALLKLAEANGYQCGVTWSQDHPQQLDVIFSLKELPLIQARGKYSESYLANYPRLSTVGDPLSRELKSALELALPDYMVPELYIVMERLPLSISGKVDKKALPVPHEADLQKEKYVMPSTQAEERMCGIWQQVLQLEKIGIHDNFFSLGGHSLLATRLISAIRHEFGTEVQLRTLFELPTIAALSESVSQMSGAFVLPPVEVVNRKQTLPLSYAQQRLWFIDQLGGGSTEYNMRGRYQLQGEFKEQALKRAIASLLERHEVLRTCYASQSGEAHQIILDEYSLPYQFYDLSQLDQESCQQKVQQLIDQEASQDFDLGQDLMLRVRALKLEEQHHVILYTIHHIAGDGWSIEIFKQELNTLYDAYCREKQNPLEPIAIQYADYALWQRGWLQGEVLSQQLDYWKEQLADIPPVHSLPLDRPRPARQTHTGKAYIQTVGQKITDQIRILCEKHGITLFMFLQSAFAVLVSRYSNQSDIVIGTPTSGRTHKDVENSIGFFVNTLVLRSKIEGNPKFSELLAANKKMVLDAYAHQHIPFEMLVDEILEERDMSYNALFQILFDVQKKDDPVQPSVDLNSEATGDELKFVPNIGVRFDLALHVKEKPESLSIRWSFRDSLFDNTSIARMARNYLQLLNSIVSALNGSAREPGVENLTLLNQQEQRTLLQNWSGNPRSFATDLCVHELIERQVSTTPDNIAVIFDDVEMSYLELNEKANRLARYLIDKGVQPEDKVVISVERSFEMMVALLAVLKSGAAYVPIDPGYPRSRIEYMLEDSGALVILTQAKFHNNLFGQRQTMCLDDEQVQQTLNSYSGLNIPTNDINLSPNNLAYVIYTSGSTGKPKGVMVNHHTVCNFLHAVQGPFLSDYIDGSVVSSPVAFDATVQSLYLPLCAGKYVELLPEDDNLIANLADYLIDDEATLLFKLTPSHLKGVANQGFDLKNFASKHVIVVAGEQLTTDTILPWLNDYLPNARFINEYGPTESTVGSCIYEISPGEIFTGSNAAVPIGKPLNNIEFYILDKHLALQPMGSAGELYIGGAGLARGYLNKPDMTQEKFIANPYSNDANARLYKTGDLVRWSTSGNIEFLGRIDSQVKIRGFRIEPGEIESVLMQHRDPQSVGVKDVVVIAREDNPDDVRLVAYVVPDKDGLSTEGKQTLNRSLLQTAKANLPSFMEPSVIVIMETLPQTPNGKVDKNALPVPGEDSCNKSRYEAPRNSVEKILCQLWQSVLQVEKVGIHDNFFALGGHSLLATRLISLIRQEFAVELQLRVLFESPTIASLSESIGTEEQGFVLPEIQKAERTSHLALSYAQERLWFIDQLNQGSLQYNMPGRYVLHGDFDQQAFKAALTAIFERHAVLRTHFVVSGGRPRQVIKQDFALPFIWHDLCHLEEQERTQQVERLIKQETLTSFDLSKDLMLRVQAIKVDDELHLILYTLHHIASDGWSMGILQNELSALYNSFRHNQDPDLVPLGRQYADYAIWQRQWLQGKVLEEQLDYWQTQLQDIPTVHSFPLDKSRPDTQTFVGMRSRQILNSALSSKIKAVCEQQQVTLFMFLQTTFALLLSRYCEDKTIVMGTPIAGRTHKDLEGLIGFFVNSLVLKTDIAAATSFEQLLATNKQMILDAYAHQHIPFENLVEELNPQRSLSFNPLFQVLFSVQNNEQAQLDLQQDAAAETVAAKKATPSDGHKPCSTRFDFEVRAAEMGDELSLIWVHNSELFDTVTFSRLAENYSTLLTSITDALLDGENTDTAIAQMNFISQKEQTLQLQSWNGQPKAWDSDACLYDLFAQQLERTPDELAFNGECGHFSYANIEHLVNLMVVEIREQKPEDSQVVGIYLNNELHSLISLLAIAKSGTIYTILDTSWPIFRLQHIVEHCQLNYLITAAELYNDLLLFSDFEVQKRRVSLAGDVLNMQRKDSSKIAQAAGDIPVFDSAAAVAMVCQVEQSGELRQTFVSHKNIVSLACNNATLNRQQVNMLQLLHGGTVDSVSLQLWSKLFNGYSVVKATSKVTSAANQSGYSMTELAALANIEHFVIRNGQLAPVGACGQLHVSGAGVAREALCSSAAVGNLTSGQSDSVALFNTAKTVRYDCNGNLSLAAGADVDSHTKNAWPEIATILQQHKGVDAACIVPVALPGQRHSFACCVSVSCLPEIDSEATIQALSARLRNQRVLYPLPHGLVLLDKFPVTEAGEPDARALAEIAREQLLKDNYVAPRNIIEQTLCGLWQDSLDIDKVGIEDNFFALGGHSLMATSLISLIRQELDIELDIKDLFETPTIAGLVESLLTNDEEVLPEVCKVDRQQRLPLSFAQQRLWFIDQLGEGSAQYNMKGRLQISGAFDSDAFKKAIRSLIERHEVLRTRFATIDGEATQIIAQDFDLPLVEHNLANLTPDETSRRVEELMSEEANTAFDLHLDLMLRVRLVHLSTQEHLIIYTMHHIASDGWSRGIFQNELSALYEAYQQGRANPLTPLNIQYADYAVWQRNWLKAEVLEKHLSWWQQQLTGIPTVHSLALDKPRPAQQSYTGKIFHQTIGAKMTAQINELCQQQGVTPFMFLQTAFALLLSRYSNQADIVIGSPVAGRNHSDIESLIGFFVNTLVLRTDLSGQPDFAQLLQSNKKTILEAYRHQHIPFEILVDKVSPQRNLSHSPLIQIFFALQNTEMGVFDQQAQHVSAESGGARKGNLQRESEYDSDAVSFKQHNIKFDLELTVTQLSYSLSCGWGFNTALFDNATITKMAERFEILLRSILDSLSETSGQPLPVNALEMFSAQDKNQLLQKHSVPELSHPSECSLASLFEIQAAKTPGNVAVHYQGAELTYEQLNSRANRLAVSLKAAIQQRTGEALKPDTLIALYLDRGPDIVVSILAVLKAGAAWVPISPLYPSGRAQTILRDADPALVVTQQHLRSEVDTWPLGVVGNLLVADESSVLHNPGNNLPPVSGAEDLACVYYVSAASGTPKGVMWEQKSINNLCQSRGQRYQLNETSHSLLYSNYVFDSFVSELFPALLSGAKVFICNEDQRGHAESLGQSMVEQGIKVATLPIGIASKLSIVHLNTLQCLFTSLPDSTAQGLSQCPQGLHLVNVNRVAEYAGSIFEHSYHVGGAITQSGTQTENVRAYVLNDSMQPVPNGTSGDLYISGPGLARGYLHRDAQTATQFVIAPFATDTALPSVQQAEPVKLFKTGDIVRWGENGELKCLGRHDRVVKVRDHQVDLCEIECILGQFPGITDVAVLLQGVDQGYLEAFVVISDEANKNTTFSKSGVRKHAANNLPDYMVPLRCTIVNEIPYRHNGELDAAALVQQKQNDTDRYIAPGNATEVRLVEIWQSVLGIDKVGIEDDFFAIGGNSLLATRLINSIRDEFAIELPLRILFESPSVKAVALQIFQDVSEQKILENEQHLMSSDKELEEGIL